MATKLLLADDSPTIQKVVNLTFAAEDVLIESVTDGNVALERARATKPDIVLADIFMPGRNGYEVCAAIKSDPVLGKTPVVLLVGTFEHFDELEASRVKCDAYLTKPFDTSELIQMVHSLVEEHSLKKSVSDRAVTLPEVPALGTIAGDAQEGMLVSDRTRESFLGSNRILDLFESYAPESAPAAPGHAEQGTDLRHSAAPSPVIPFPGTRTAAPSPIALTEDMVDLIVERVVKRMSTEVVREIAWEVVPELAEIMIRQHLDEIGTPGKK